MNKLRPISWFFLLVTLLVTLVSYSMAQESVPAPEAQVFSHTLSQSKIAEPLVRSATESQAELAAARQLSQIAPASSLRLSPATTEDTLIEPPDPVGSPGLPLPDDLYDPLAPVTEASSLAVPDIYSDNNEHNFDFSGRFVGRPEGMPVSSPTVAASCQQLLGNITLDWNVGAGTFLPWVILDPIVYYSTGDYTSAPHSTVLVDADSGDPNPGQDAFAQAFAVPPNLTEVRIEYETASLNSNSTDDTFGNLWSVDSGGNLDQPIVGWEVGPSEGAWQGRFVEFNSPTDLQALQGRDIAIILYNATDGSAPGEVVFFDDITFTACYEDAGQIIVKKETDPAGSPQIFTFQASWTGSDFDLSDGQSEHSEALAPGTYSVSELPVSGWTQTSATCDDGSSPGSISLQAGETVTCTFYNKEDPGQIIVKKETDPAGSPQIFTFQASWTGSDFDLSDGQSEHSGALAPGTYSVSELPVSGWSQTSATCDDGSSPGSISLQAGETVTCTFYNKEVIDDDAYIIVRKQVSPAGATQKFKFQASWLGNGQESYDFELSGGQSKQSAVLTPGTYSVSELPVSGWNLAGATCSDGSNPANISLQAGETVTCVFHNVNASCDQVLANTQLDIVEFGDGTGTAEPWSVIIPIVYYIDDPAYAYDGYSLILEDGDSDGPDPDPDPTIDMFAQGFLMPDDLNEISVEYMRAMLDSNPNDDVYGELWLLDDDWVLHLDDPDNYFVGSWTVAESEAVWAKQSIVSSDPSFLNKMAGKKMAILFFNITDGGGATEAEKEWVLFDDVNLYACTQAHGEIFMPAIMHDYGVPVEVDPICTPPNENPFDQWHSNRGLVQTSAVCNSTLSNVDLADYYTFVPDASGQHTLHLTDLPAGTQWSSMIFFDTASPSYVPGPTDGDCRIGTSGAGDKQVSCDLNEGTGYFVKVSSGSTPVAGSYTMKITKP